MQTLTYFTISFAPIIFLAMYLYIRKHRDRKFVSLMIRSMVAGVFSISVLALAIAISYELGISELRNLKRTLFFAFITIGGSAELGKFLVYRYIIMRDSVNVSPFDAIILSVCVALGYCTVALVGFALNFGNIQQSLPVTLFSFAFIPGSLIFSIVMGFFIGMARFLKTHIVFSLTSLIGAAFFHGIFIFCMVTRDYKLLSLFAFGSSVIVFILAMKAVFTVPEKSE
ncbi:MAG: hypothetical protein NT004_13650 [Bacteroidetes bacterium]|nr:hypothetical protein [Bacteroidota bacterium]